MSPQVLALDPRGYQPHLLHDDAREWQETNCATDLWIEGLHALGLDPLPALGFTLGTDFDGDQWRMFTFPPEDLRLLYGIETDELNVWRPLVHHVDEQLGLGRLVIIDVDAWYLPDTRGLTYRQAHQKTSVMAQMIDADGRRLGYFHNAGYYELEGEDFDGLLGVGAPPEVLPPFVLTVRLDKMAPRDPATLAPKGVALARAHLARQPLTNPLERMAKRLEEDLEWLQRQGLEVFHRYAFGTLRQCGANAELAATFAAWLGQATGTDTSEAQANLHQVSAGMKSVEFLLARAVRGRSGSWVHSFAALAGAWEAALVHLAGCCG